MRRIRIIVLLETLLIALAISPAEAVPVQGLDGYFSELVPTLVTGLAARAEHAFLAGPAPVGWLGGSDRASEGTWTWIDEPWGLAQPDSGGAQSFLFRRPRGWDDFNGGQGYSVRYAAPEPGTFLLFGTALAAAGLAGWHQRRRGRALGRTGG
jgi:hypothetical protein